jgi:hypothetical protein
LKRKNKRKGLEARARGGIHHLGAKLRLGLEILGARGKRVRLHFCEIDELNLIVVNSCMIVVVMFENMICMIIVLLLLLLNLHDKMGLYVYNMFLSEIGDEKCCG